MRDIITILLNKLLRNNTGYAIFEIRTPKVKLYNFLMRLNLLGVLNQWKLHKKYLKWEKRNPLEYSRMVDIITNELDQFLAYGRL